MRSWRYSYADPSFGDLHQERVTIPSPRSGQVLIRINAASLNPIDIYRLTRRSPDRGAHQCIGFDYAGVITETNATSKRFAPGQRVFGSIHESGGQIGTEGSLQENVTMDETRLVPMPNRLGFVEAASVPVVGVTAIQAFDRVKLQAGESVLITGGSGGVGTIAIQIAKQMFGASKVFTTIRSHDRVDICHRLGSSQEFVTDEGRAWPDDEPVPRVDVVLDCTNQGTALRRLFRGQSSTRLISISTFDDPDVECFGAHVGDVQCLTRLIPYLESGAIVPVVAKTFGFFQVYKALEFLRYGRPIGKVVIDLSQDETDPVAA